MKYNLSVKFRIILISIVLTLFLFLLSYKLVLAATVLTANQQETINYLQGKAESSLPFTENEKQHLQEVKNVISRINYLFYIIIAIIISVGSLWKGYTVIKYNSLAASHCKKVIPLNQKSRNLYHSSIITLTVTILIFLWIIIDFQSLFTIFHYLFFPQGNWLFQEDSLLIKTFPFEFFVGISFNIFIMVLVLAGTIYFLTRRFK